MYSYRDVCQSFCIDLQIFTGHVQKTTDGSENEELILTDRVSFLYPNSAYFTPRRLKKQEQVYFSWFSSLICRYIRLFVVSPWEVALRYCKRTRGAHSLFLRIRRGKELQEAPSTLDDKNRNTSSQNQEYAFPSPLRPSLRHGILVLCRTPRNSGPVPATPFIQDTHVK